MKPAKKVNPREDKEGWDKTLARFREIFDAQYTVQNGQPSGVLVPEAAIAETNKFAKEDLKRSVSGFFTSLLSIISLIR